jgi:hypothetical protein
MLGTKETSVKGTDTVFVLMEGSVWWGWVGGHRTEAGIPTVVCRYHV